MLKGFSPFFWLCSEAQVYRLEWDTGEQGRGTFPNQCPICQPASSALPTVSACTRTYTTDTHTYMQFHASKHSHTRASKLLVCDLVSACYDIKHSILECFFLCVRPDKLDISTAMHLDAVKRKIPALLSYDTFYGKREGWCWSLVRCALKNTLFFFNVNC